jgi:hypothetical protein
MTSVNDAPQDLTFPWEASTFENWEELVNEPIKRLIADGTL